MACVFDTSVLIAIIKQERGYKGGLEFLQDEVFMSTVNLAEFFSWVNIHSEMKNKEMADWVQELEIKVVDFDLKHAINSSEMIAETKRYGLSLGDRVCLALGQKLKLPIVTCDKVWEKVAIECEIVALR